MSERAPEARRGATPWRDLLLLAGAGAALRLVGGLQAAVISRDGIAYLESARRFLALDPSAFKRHTAPGFPLVVGLWGQLAGVSEAQALVIAALCGGLSVIALGLLAGRLGGARALRLGAALGAFLPLLAELGGEVLSEPLFLAALPWALYALLRLASPERGPAGGLGWGLLAGLSGGLAYLTRPEGILILLAGAAVLIGAPRPGVSWRRKAADLAWLTWPAALLVVAFMVAIREEAVLGGSQGGAWKLTLKRNLGYHLGLLSPSLALSHLGEQARRCAIALLPASGFLAASACASRAAGRGEPALGSALGSADARLLRWLLTATGLALTSAYVIVRPDRRYAAPLALLCLSPLAAGAARWLGRAPGARVRALLLVGTLAALALPLTLRPRRAAKLSYRLAGERLRELGARRVLAHDSRAAHYAGAEALELLWLDPREASPEGASGGAGAGIAALVSRVQADALVLVVETPAQAAEASALGALWGDPGERIAPPRSVPLRLWVRGAR